MSLYSVWVPPVPPIHTYTDIHPPFEMSEAGMSSFLNKALSLLLHNAFRLLLLPSHFAIAAMRLLFRLISRAVHNNLIRRFANHLIRLPFQITATITHLLYQLSRRVLYSTIATLSYLLKTPIFARVTQYTVYLGALMVTYSVISVHLKKCEYRRQRKHAEDEKEKTRELFKRVYAKHLLQEQKAQEERQRHARDQHQNQSKPKQQQGFYTSSRPRDASESSSRQYIQHRETPSHDFQTWRNECKVLAKDKASVTALPQAPKDLAILYKRANLSTAELKMERQIWHPDAWSKVPEPHKAKVVKDVTQVFQIVNPIYVESSR
jgi:ABC-type multidrug transport system fused ATPase/permease subunit